MLTDKDRDQLREAPQALARLLEAALAIHTDIILAQARLDRDGMYPATPTEDWQSRGGRQYLYMAFPQEPGSYPTRYRSPNGKRKAYIGNKPHRIQEARRKAENRRRWQKLDDVRHNLELWLRDIQRRLDRLELSLSHPPGQGLKTYKLGPVAMREVSHEPPE